ncbi:hypothetical protein D9619_008435 [Psilocybe cf. subviscida]|uniref:Uncharacterized protein n=1 Tax=Psilocybe cf. subviscida TaxID=2480587 RepID=A0A8H5BC30_9AGAR|nr:hypothetical protein D9619_008435 [Psilocybe cf. subviscida]
MDPLSVTLAVISLTTAVRDLVEVGKKIHESFAKMSNNFRNAQRVAEDIKEMVEEIRVFCEGHIDGLDNMKDFCLALLGLLVKFRSFEASILPLLPQTGGRRRDRLFRGWDAWRNNNKIEEHLLDIQGNIVKVMRRYMMKSAMRTEVKLETNRQEISQGLKDVHKDVTQGLQVLEVVRRDVSALRTTTATTTMTHYSYESLATTSEELNRSVIMFAQSSPSTAAPMLRTPNVITEELMTTAYIKLQFNNIALAVEKMSMLPASAANSIASNRVMSFQILSMAKQSLMSVTHLRRYVAQQVSTICNLLDAPSIHIVSIHDGPSALTWLSGALALLGMDHETRLAGEWAITLAKILVDASGGEPDYSLNLALCLLNQSREYGKSGDKTRSLQLIKEAYTITQNLRNQYNGETHLPLGVQQLQSNILSQYAGLVDNKRSIEMCVEAVRILEDIFNTRAFTQSKSHEGIIIKSVVQPSSSFLDRLFLSAPPISAIRGYAFALQGLGTYLFIDGHPETALDLALLAIALFRKMVSIHGHEYRMNLASALSSLVHGSVVDLMPGEEVVVVAEECIQLFRDLAEENPLYYARSLYFVLWKKACTLMDLDRDAEAIVTLEEAASIAEQVIQDSALCADVLDQLGDHFRRLNRHDDAARTAKLAITMYHESPEMQAQRYFHLARDLQQLRRYNESTEAARTCVALYRRLAMRDPERWMTDLTGGLSNLAHCLAASGRSSEALMAWRESVGLLNTFLNRKPDSCLAGPVIDQYLTTLLVHSTTSYVLENTEECLKVSSTAIQQILQLSEVYPLNTQIVLTLLQAQFCHAYNMLRVGRLQVGHQYLRHWHAGVSSKLEDMQEISIASWHAAMSNLNADVLDAQGSTEQALLAIQEARTYCPLFVEMIRSMVIEARLQGNLGDGGEALQVAERALQRARDSKFEPMSDSRTSAMVTVWSLHAVAFAAMSHWNYNRVIETAQEGCNILAISDGLDFDRGFGSEYRALIRPSLFALQSSAQANLGRYSTALEYANRAVDASLEIGEMKAYISATTAEQSYMETRGSLAEILLATGNRAQARQICDERRAYFSKRVEERMGEYRDLAPILRMLGILCCSEGRHEEGNTAAKELSRIMKALGSAYPSLQEQVKFRLRRQVQVPILKFLNDMSQKLECGHQTDVVSLFAL